MAARRIKIIECFVCFLFVLNACFYKAHTMTCNPTNNEIPCNNLTRTQEPIEEM